MKLIEKKCPNCGASLEFSENDKSCKCTYCKRAFEIERDQNQENITEQFDLKPIKKGLLFAFLPFSIFPIFIIILFIIIAVISNINSFTRHNEKKYDNYSDDSYFDDFFGDDNSLITSVSDLSNSEISSIDSKSKMLISSTGEGVNDVHHSYSIAGDKKKEKLYVAYKKGSNYIITIYKALYHDFFHQENSYTVYIPIIFENIKTDVVFSLDGGKVSAPEYYFNQEKTSYTYGYASFEDAYNGVVKPLESEYTITEK